VVLIGRCAAPELDPLCGNKMKHFLPILFGLIGTFSWNYWGWTGILTFIGLISVIYISSTSIRRHFNKKTAILVDKMSENEKKLFLEEMDEEQRNEILNYMENNNLS
jgi:hypothetical protein